MKQKLLLLSDTHGNSDLMSDVIARHQNNVDMIIHAGDGQFKNKNELSHLIAVQGNMSEQFELPTEQRLSVLDNDILILHGHLHDNIAYNPMKLSFMALEKQVNIVIFGHIHQPFVSYYDQLLLINPGSLAKSRDFRLKAEGTYAILTISDNCYDVEFYDQDGKLLQSLSRQYTKE